MLKPKQIQAALKKVGLPPRLVELIRSGQLEQEVERVRRQTEQLNELLDAWEAGNPEAAAIAPWRQARDAWNKAGRPEAPWWELLYAAQVLPLRIGELDGTVIKEHEHRRYQRYRSDPELWERYRAQRRAADNRCEKRRVARRKAEAAAAKAEAEK